MLFRRLDIKEQLRIEQQRNKALQAHVKDLEDAIVELAEIVTEEENDG